MSETKTAALLLDNYKVALFKEKLTEAGFSFKEIKQKDLTTLSVTFTPDRFIELTQLVGNTNNEALRKFLH